MWLPIAVKEATFLESFGETQRVFRRQALHTVATTQLLSLSQRRYPFAFNLWLYWFSYCLGRIIINFLLRFFLFCQNSRPNLIRYPDVRCNASCNLPWILRVINCLLQFYYAMSRVKPTFLRILSFAYATRLILDWAEVEKRIIILEHLLASIVDNQVHIFILFVAYWLFIVK